MNYWWVNQKQSYDREVPGGYLWCPQLKKNGSANRYYTFLNHVTPGDIVFSYANGLIKAIGMIITSATVQPNPHQGLSKSWAPSGFHVPVDFYELTSPFSPKAHLAQLLPLPTADSPLKANGDGKEFYITAIPNSFATGLISIIGQTKFDGIVGVLQGNVDQATFEADDDVQTIQGRVDIGPTEKKRLSQARRGQGIFKNNVRVNEKACRLTNVTDLRHLRASHIKPWSACTDIERLDGNNGLLLAPHIDHLFDRGWISFKNNGELMVSRLISPNVLPNWGITPSRRTPAFSSAQQIFLDHHRQYIFKK